jgi:hypothetical protein
MTNKVSKTKLNQTCVSGKTTLWLVQHGIKTGQSLESLLGYTKALKLITFQLEEQLKNYKEQN